VGAPAVVGNVDTRRADAPTPAGDASKTGAATRLVLFQGFQLIHNGVGVRLSTGAQHLLAFLALSYRAVRRSHVAGALWEDASEERAAGNLRSAIWRLRRTGLDLIAATRDHVCLAPTVVVDIYQLAGIAALVADPAANIATLNLEEMPLAGELLPDWDDDWVLLERERQRQIALHVLEALCERWTREGHFERAVGAGLAAVASEPLRESSNRALIGAFLAEGNPAEAIRRYRYFRQKLRSELRMEPSDRITEMVAGLSSR
jgi:DNA-binding SARP family transcriptional activator